MANRLTGTSHLGFSRGETTRDRHHAIDPASGQELEPPYFAASADEVERAVRLAADAFPAYSALPGKRRAAFLRAIAERIEAAVEDIVRRGPLETGLPEPRLRGETARTCGQLRLFATLLEEGSWVDARVDRAQPDRQPLPKPDLRAMLVPLGPVAVFGASNFPLAFSVAGGDTASALAAGCPVVVKAHESHPGLAEIVGDCIVDAARELDLPEGVFSLLHGAGHEIGQALVRHPAIQAVGFTGSRRGGLALMAASRERPQPIPVYAEMSSINPIVLLPSALAERGAAIAEGLVGSLTLGSGQFCTNPGLVFLPEEHGAAFLDKLAELVAAAPPAVMLNPGILDAYQADAGSLAELPGVETLARGKDTPRRATPAVFTVSMRRFLEERRLHAEIFGPATLVVRGSLEEITASIGELEGQLTATVHGTEAELDGARDLLDALARKSGRLILNGFPTGVEVCPSMVHGGPFPATSDGRSTSVGTLAIRRFCRLFAWQDFPQQALPKELRDDNPLGIRRLEDGAWSA